MRVLALPLLVALVLADDQNRSVTADDLALLAHRLDRRSYLHDPFRRLGSGGSALAAVVAAATGSWRCSHAHKSLRVRAGPRMVATPDAFRSSAARCHGVRIFGPSPVTATVNSKCAAAQPSPATRTAGRPAVVIGSTASTMPSYSNGPFPGFP